MVWKVLKRVFEAKTKKTIGIRREEFRCQVEQLQEGRLEERVRTTDIQVMLKEKFSADYALPSVYHVLERANLNWIRARSKHPKSNIEKQEN